MKRATLALSLWDVKEEEQKVGSRVSFRPKLDPGGAGQERERERVWDLLGRRRWRKHSPRSSFFPFAIARYTQQQCSTCLVWHSAISPSLFSAHIQSWTTVPFSCQLWLLSKHQNPRLVRRPKRRMSFGQKRIPPFPSSCNSRVTRTITTGLCPINNLVLYVDESAT